MEMQSIIESTTFFFACLVIELLLKKCCDKLLHNSVYLIVLVLSELSVYAREMQSVQDYIKIFAVSAAGF